MNLQFQIGLKIKLFRQKMTLPGPVSFHGRPPGLVGGPQGPLRLSQPLLVFLEEADGVDGAALAAPL